MLDHEVKVMPCPNCNGYNITTRPLAELTNFCHCNECGKNYEICLTEALRTGCLSTASQPYADALGQPVKLDRLDLSLLADNVRRLAPYGKGYIE